MRGASLCSPSYAIGHTLNHCIEMDKTNVSPILWTSPKGRMDLIGAANQSAPMISHVLAKRGGNLVPNEEKN